MNVSARNLRRGQTRIIGLAIPDLQMPYFAQLSSLVIEEAKKVGLRVDCGADAIFARWRVGSAARVPVTMIDGLIYSPLELGQDDVEQLKVDYPLVLVGERISTDQVDHIATENVEGAKGHAVFADDRLPPRGRGRAPGGESRFRRAALPRVS